MINKFEMMGSSPEKSKEFEQLSALMRDKNHIEGTSSKGAVYINKWPNGSIEVLVIGHNGVNTKFTISEGMDVIAEAEKPATKKSSHDDDGIERHQYLSPEFTLDDVLYSFKENTQEESDKKE